MPESDCEIQWVRDLIDIAEECLERQRTVIEASQADSSITRAALDLYHNCQELLAVQQKMLVHMENRRGKTLKDLREQMEQHENAGST